MSDLIKTPNKSLTGVCLTTLILLATILSGCASKQAQTEQPRQHVRANAMQGWNRCLQVYMQEKNDSGKTLSIAESMETCQGYRHDIISTYPPHLSASIDKLLTDAAYRSRYASLSSKVEPVIGEVKKQPSRKALDLMLNQARF